MLVDPGPESTRGRRCSRRSAAREPRALLLTHIHFDHAGATGALVRRWPDLPVYVHERGAPHMVDPERLVASAARLYGGEEGLRAAVGRGRARCRRRNLHVLQRRRDACSDDFRVEYTPGHASHHVCYLHEPSAAARSSATSAACGSRRRDYVVAPTPPPDIDVEAWEPLARHRRGLGAAGARADALRRASTTSARTSPRCASACTRSLRLAAQHGPGGVRGGRDRAGRAQRRRPRRRSTPRRRRPSTSTSACAATSTSARA